MGAAILAAVAWIYWPALHGGWVWDDDLEVVRNGALRLGPGGLGRIWLAVGAPDYFPLKTTFQWMEWHAWGADTAAYHIVNLVLHGLCAVLFWRLLVRLFRIGGAASSTVAAVAAARATGGEEWTAWLGGLIFAVHPLAVESAAWIAELKNVLSLALLLASALAYVGFDSTGRRRAYAASLGLFVAALLSKTTVVMFPAAILLFAWWRRGRIDRSDLLRSAPFFALSLTLGLITVVFQAHRTAAGSMAISGLGSRAASAGLAVAFYAGKFFFPVQLLPAYPSWPTPVAVRGALAWLALAVLFGGMWRARRGWGRHALFGAGFFVLNLLPILGFIPMAFLQVGPVADHLCYISLLGLAGLTAATLGGVHRKAGFAGIRPEGAPGASALSRRLPVALAIGLGIGAISIISHCLASNYDSNLAFWNHAFEGNPQSWTAANNLGDALTQAGEPRRAIAVLEAGLRLEPANARAWYNLGVAEDGVGRRDAAANDYETAVRRDPGLADAWNNLGRELARKGRAGAARSCFERAIALDPELAAARSNLGLALAREGDYDAAMVQYRAALRLRPDNAEAYGNLGDALARAGRWDEAVAAYDAALSHDPRLVTAWINRSNVLLELGRLAEAVEGYEKALRLAPDNAAARGNLARARALEGASAGAP